MRKLVIIPNANKDKDFVVTDKVVNELSNLGFDVFVNASSGYHSEKVNTYDALPDGIDLIVVVGGDGSVIDASQIAVEYDIPILGINLGRMGYLTEVEVDAIHELRNLSYGDYSIIEKMLLSVTLGDKPQPCGRYAVNDVALSRDGILRISDINIEDSIGNSFRVRADGVVLSTPQGSTAYSFSAGGPIVAHDVESVVLTPVSPHSFFNRSVLFNSAEVIKLTNVGDAPLNVSVDGRCIGALSSGEYCRVMKAPKKVKMLTFKKNSMFSSLFRKMRVLGDID